MSSGELDGSTCRWLMHLDQIHYLPDDVLMKTDRASMLCSLEIRTAFLHGGLAELAGSVDTSARPPCRKAVRSEEHTSELQSRPHLVCRLLLAKKKSNQTLSTHL